MSVRRERYRGNVTVQYLDPTAVPRDDIVFGPITLNKISETEMGTFTAGPSTFYVTSIKVDVSIIPFILSRVWRVILTFYVDNNPGLVLAPVPPTIQWGQPSPDYLSEIYMTLDFQAGQRIVVKGKLYPSSSTATRDATVTIKGSYTNPIV